MSGDGSYTPASGFTAARAGTYWWYASYSGDNSDNPVASTCGTGMAHTDVSQRGGGAPVSVRFVGSPRSTGKGALFALRCLAPAAQRCRTDDTLTSTETLAGGKPIAVSAARRAKRLKRTIVLGRKRVIISAGRAQAITIPLNAHGRTLLRTLHKLPVMVTIKLTSNGKATVVLNRRLTIKPKTRAHGSSPR